MGFDVEEVPSQEEIPYSFYDYLMQPIKLSRRIFTAMVSNPKLRYWILALLISSIFTATGSWLVLNKLKLVVRVSEELPQVTPSLVENIVEAFLRNPLIIFINSLISEVITSLLAAVIIFALVRSLAGKGSFSSSVMIAGLRSLPSIAYGVLLALLGFSMPEVEWVIEVGPQFGLSGARMSVPWEIFAQEFLLQFFISIWFLLVLLMSFLNGYGMVKGKAAAASLITWIVSNAFLIIGILPYI